MPCPQQGSPDHRDFPPFRCGLRLFLTTSLGPGLCGRGPHGAFIMSKKFKGRIDGPFVALLKSTIKTEAWKALSHGARSLYVALRSRYNPKTENADYLSTRDAWPIQQPPQHRAVVS